MPQPFKIVEAFMLIKFKRKTFLIKFERYHEISKLS